MGVVGFNVGSTISLGDMSLAIDYLLDKESFEPELQEVKEKITNRQEDGGKKEERFNGELKIVTDKSDELDNREIGNGTSEDDEYDLSDMEEYYDDGDYEDGDVEEEYLDDEDEYFEDEDDYFEDEYFEDEDDYFEDEYFEDEDDSVEVKPSIQLEDSEVRDKKESEIERALRKKEEELKRRLAEIERKEELKRREEEARLKELQALERKILEAEKRLKTNDLARDTVENKKVEVKARGQRTAPRKVQPKNGRADSIQMYSELDIDALYNEVRTFMQSKGVAKSIIDRRVIEKRFGSHNIRKLILKSYLISIGKGVTIGK